MTSSPSGIDPIFVSVHEAAKALSLSAWQVYQLLDEEAIDSRYQGRRRLVNVKSLRAYADGLSKYPNAG